MRTLDQSTALLPSYAGNSRSSCSSQVPPSTPPLLSATSGQSDSTEGRRSVLGSLVIAPLYGMRRSGLFRSMLRRLALRFEGGAMYSLTVRDLYRRHHDLEVGLYTIGPCEAGPTGLDPGTTIGRYCSIYYTVRTITVDETVDDGRGPVLAFGSAVDGKRLPERPRNELLIGNDVFIGHNSIILPTTGSIGDGAFIGAGSVVQNPVPPFGVVMGNPARVVRYRFSEATIQELLASKWWLKSAKELRRHVDEFRRPLEGDSVR